ncbi:MAG: hypothetical protein VB067_14855 [Christensenellaceae bacterium]|nr:hypothetical protein [Christensenellaceae bacterium]MEA5067144.1 hypothetical protein [Eubacteriales bacterium]MEA5070270.1 hypothetical protein [Christensenellaceae bacterium]
MDALKLVRHDLIMSNTELFKKFSNAQDTPTPANLSALAFALKIVKQKMSEFTNQGGSYDDETYKMADKLVSTVLENFH